MKIRKSIESDKRDIETIHTLAFGEEKGPEIAELVRDLFDDKTAKPQLSLVAVDDHENLIGHILFTKATLTLPDNSASVQLLAPLAVLPDVQKTGIGGLLIEEGLRLLKKEGVDLVFVLGHPEYYPRTGFTPAGVHGFQAPYPIPEEHASAWMVQELVTDIIENVKGTVKCSEVLDMPQHWRE